LPRLHLIEKQALSRICEAASRSPTQFYAWQEQLFANGSAALASKRVSERNKEPGRHPETGKWQLLARFGDADRTPLETTSRNFGKEQLAARAQA
jgi:hypothetical protein